MIRPSRRRNESGPPVPARFIQERNRSRAAFPFNSSTLVARHGDHPSATTGFRRRFQRPSAANLRSMRRLRLSRRPILRLLRSAINPVLLALRRPSGPSCIELLHCLRRPGRREGVEICDWRFGIFDWGKRIGGMPPIRRHRVHLHQHTAAARIRSAQRALDLISAGLI